MNDSVFNARFVNMSRFWIGDVKWDIIGVSIGFVFQFQVQTEQIIFQITLKLLNVSFLPFAFSEFFPRQKQVF